MSSQATPATCGRRERMRKVMSVVDRTGLGLMYALIIIMLPVTAVGFLNRTV